MGAPELKIEHWPVGRLVPYARNPRVNDQAVPQMAAVIREFGFKVPIVARSDGSVVDGHLRLKAALHLGLEAVPVVLADEWTDAQVKAFRIAVNKSAEWADWDQDLLRLEMEDLQALDFDLDLTGFSAAEVDALLQGGAGGPGESGSEGGSEGGTESGSEGHTAPDAVPEAREEPVSRLGDIWLLGRHRLMCGDSTDAGNVALLMNGEKADMVFTDPPYGMGKEKDGVLNDNQNATDLLEFNRRWIPNSFNALKPSGSWYCWGMDEPLMDIYGEILKPMQKEKRITFRNLLTWDKGDAGAGGVSFMGQEGLRSYPIGSEKCLFVMCGVQGINNNADHYFEGWEPIRQYLASEAERVGLTAQKLKEICGVGMFSHWFTKSQWTFIPEHHYRKLQEHFNGKAFRKDYDEMKAAFFATRAYFDNTHDKMTDVWTFGRVTGDERAACGGHATPKPLALCDRAVKTSTPSGGIILDLFGGSGSTLIACEKTGRVCRMMELSPRYVDVIVRRWQDFTGQEATLEEDGRTFAAVKAERGA